MSKSINMLGFCLVAALMLQFVCADLKTSFVNDNELAPCDQKMAICMKWCGSSIRRPGFCENGGFCCDLVRK
ncbi:uncharacterized protein Dmoj_GI25627 [Drosophila mojavensis]|uniref:Uncharacterized protein n=1 Tax=Drosophila mojavensis TaxID=7230 RepID=A0A0Q9XLI4_DROMO|nr:uncharacterized protein Dmoj_GI25627 [Drosophila mojavensis]